MKALTVQQPWAWAVVYGGKNPENRTQAWTHRGPLAIHAGRRLSQRGCLLVPALLEATRPDLDPPLRSELVFGAIIGVVDLVDVHGAEPGCCDSPWAEYSYVEHGGRTRRDVVHLVHENPRPVEPVPCLGRLGLWTPPREVLEQLEAVASC